MNGVHFVDYKGGHGLYRGPRPSSSRELSGLNCQTVINLESGWYERLQRVAFEEDWWVRPGVELKHLPLGDVFPPSDYQIATFIKLVLKGLEHGNVYVHCLHGVDRTGFMCAAYRIKVQGWSPDRAIEEMLALGFHQFPYWFWLRKLKFS